MNVTIEVEVLKYDELPPDYKIRLLHEEFEAVREMWNPDFLVDEFKKELAAIGFEDAQVWYSGFGNQGDGACFDAKVNLEKVCKHLGIEFNLNDEIGCSIEIVNHHYSHERTRRIDCDGSEDLQVAIEELRLNRCRDFYKRLEADADSESSEETLLGYLRSRMFTYRNDIEQALTEATEELKTGTEGVQIIGGGSQITRTEDTRYYADEDDGEWYVFDSSVEPHKAVSSWSCEQDAKDDADRRNEAP